VLTQVPRGSAAEKAGFAAGDEWLAVQPVLARNATATKAQLPGQASGPWRMHGLDDLRLYCGTAKKVLATVARDKRLLTLPLTLPTTSFSARLSVRDPFGSPAVADPRRQCVATWILRASA